MPDPELALDDVVSRRFDLDEQIALIQGRHAAELAPMIEELKLCENFVKAELLASNQQSWKSSRTGHSTNFTTKSSCSVTDWDALLAYIKANEAWQLLNHAVNKIAVKEVITATAGVVPGADYKEFRDLIWKRGRT
jgi:hypothetical protein